MSFRNIDKIFRGEDKKEGAGVKVKRIFDRKNTEKMDPFLLMDFFDLNNPDDYKGGFPWHPHRGIETITYMIEGEVYHEDTLKNEGSISDGECQWMVSGNGIMHQELLIESEKMLGVQIWLNIAKEDKMLNPSYRDLRVEDIKMVEDGRVKIISGEYRGEYGPVVRNDKIRPTIVDVGLGKGEEFIYEIEKENTLFLFILSGEGIFDGEILGKGNGVLYKRDSGNKTKIRSNSNNFRFLLLSGKPLKEPIAWEGPISMNTKEELDIAFDELNKHEFIKYRG